MKLLRGLLLVGLIASLMVWIGAAQAPQIKIGVLGKSVHPYWDVVRVGVEKAATRFPDVRADFFVPPVEDIPKQIATVEAWIAAGYQVLSLAPSDPKAMEATIKKALDLGRIVFTQDTDAPGSGRFFYLGTGNYAAGRAAGEAMVKLLSALPGGASGKKVAILTGSLTALNSLERMQGFRDVVEPAGVKVVDTLNDREDVSTAVSLIEAELSAVPDLAGLFGVYAASTTGIAQALKTAGKTGAIQAVGFDTLKEHLQFTEEGALDALVGQRQYFMGYHSVTIGREMVLKGTGPILTGLYLAGLATQAGLDPVALVEKFVPQAKDIVKELQDSGIGFSITKDGIFLNTGTDVVYSTKDSICGFYSDLKKMGIEGIIGWTPDPKWGC
jgi:ribose transport system substrate-binding protein